MTEYIGKTTARRAALAPCEKCWKESRKTPVCNDCKLYGVAQAIDRIPAAFSIAQIGEIPSCDVRFVPANVQALDENGLPFFSNHAERIKKTNADRIRGMTDEELAERFALMSCCEGNYANCYKYSQHNGGGRDCEKCWLDYLRQEAEE